MPPPELHSALRDARPFRVAIFMAICPGNKRGEPSQVVRSQMITWHAEVPLTSPFSPKRKHSQEFAIFKQDHDNIQCESSKEAGRLQSLLIPSMAAVTAFQWVTRGSPGEVEGSVDAALLTCRAEKLPSSGCWRTVASLVQATV
ncbi:UNVERIFIED_CONTAM: hypothetical protein K2H54_053613 [Gekko kuhli]